MKHAYTSLYSLNFYSTLYICAAHCGVRWYIIITEGGKERLEQEQSCSKIIGKRVCFKLVNDPYSDPKFNDLGTVVGVTALPDLVGRRTKLWIRWDASYIL